MVAGRVVMGTGLEPGGGGRDCERRLNDPRPPPPGLVPCPDDPRAALPAAPEQTLTVRALAPAPFYRRKYRGLKEQVRSPASCEMESSLERTFDVTGYL